MTSVLIVEDEESLADPLAFLLRKEGFETTVVTDGPSALAEFERAGADIVLLDLMLPGMSGTDVCKQLRSRSSVPVIMDDGASFYKNYGTGRSRGTQPFQLAGNVKQGGLIEKAFGVTLKELIYDFGGGTLSGRPVRAVQVGGPLGAYLPADQLDIPMDYEAFAAVKAMLGHGGIVVFDDTVDMAQQARFAMEFCAVESCGKCTPCRVGSTRGVEVIDRIIRDESRVANIELLKDLCNTLKFGSLCELGGFTPYPVMSAITHFPEDFGITPPSRQAAE